MNTSAQTLAQFRNNSRCKAAIQDMVVVLAEIEGTPAEHIDGLANLLEIDSATAEVIHRECLADANGMKAAFERRAQEFEDQHANL